MTSRNSIIMFVQKMIASFNLKRLHARYSESLSSLRVFLGTVALFNRERILSMFYAVARKYCAR